MRGTENQIIAATVVPVLQQMRSVLVFRFVVGRRLTAALGDRRCAIAADGRCLTAARADRRHTGTSGDRRPTSIPGKCRCTAAPGDRGRLVAPEDRRRSSAVSPFAVAIAITALISSGWTTRSFAQVQSKTQQGCSAVLAKAAMKASKMQGKLGTSCMKMAAKRKLEAGRWAQDCLVDDAKGKVAAARQTALDGEAKHCTVPPDFGYAGASLATTAATSEQIELLAELLGSSLQAAVRHDKRGARCEQKIAKRATQIVAAMLKEYYGCKKDGLADGSIASAADLDACFDAIVTDARGKIGRLSNKTADEIGKACGGATGFLDVFSPLATGQGAPEQRVKQRVRCRVCRMLNRVEGLGHDCDLFDDGQGNTSCTCPPEYLDCSGLCYGQAAVDHCGVCGGDNTGCDVILVTPECGSGPPGFTSYCTLEEALADAASKTDPVIEVQPGQLVVSGIVTKSVTIRAADNNRATLDLGQIDQLGCPPMLPPSRLGRRSVILKGTGGTPALQASMGAADRLILDGIGVEAAAGQPALLVSSGSVQATNGHVIGAVRLSGPAAKAVFENVRLGSPRIKARPRESSSLPVSSSYYAVYTSTADCDIANVSVTGGGSYVGLGTEIVGADDIGIGVCVDAATAKLCNARVHDVWPVDSSDPTVAWAVGQYGRGGYVTGGGTLRATASEFYDNHEMGLLAAGTGSQLVLRSGTRVFSNGRGAVMDFSLGIGVQTSASIDVDSSSVSGNEGVGVYVSTAALASITDSAVTNNMLAGIVVVGGGLSADGLQASANTADRSAGGGFGVCANHLVEGPSSVSLANAAIEDNELAGVYVEGDGGTVSVSSSSLRNHPGLPLSATTRYFGNGVYARGACSGLSLTGNNYEGNSSAHVMLDGSNATLGGSSYTTNGVLDFVQQGCSGCVVPLGSLALAADGLTAPPHLIEICPTYDHLTRADCDARLYLTEAVVIE